jgi:hypothetical protein
LQLERNLDDQQTVRGALEKALGPNPAPVILPNESPILKVAFFNRINIWFNFIHS